MAKVKAKISFAGVTTMGKGEIKEISDETVLADLLSAGYVEKLEDPVETPDETPKGKKTVKKGDK